MQRTDNLRRDDDVNGYDEQTRAILHQLFVILRGTLSVWDSASGESVSLLRVAEELEKTGICTGIRQEHVWEWLKILHNEGRIVLNPVLNVQKSGRHAGALRLSVNVRLRNAPYRPLPNRSKKKLDVRFDLYGPRIRNQYRLHLTYDGPSKTESKILDASLAILRRDPSMAKELLTTRPQKNQEILSEEVPQAPLVLTRAQIEANNRRVLLRTLEEELEEYRKQDEIFLNRLLFVLREKLWLSPSDDKQQPISLLKLQKELEKYAVWSDFNQGTVWKFLQMLHDEGRISLDRELEIRARGKLLTNLELVAFLKVTAPPFQPLPTTTDQNAQEQRFALARFKNETNMEAPALYKKPKKTESDAMAKVLKTLRDDPKEAAKLMKLVRRLKRKLDHPEESP